MITSMLTSKE